MKNIILTKQGTWKFYHDKNLGICFYGPQNKTPMILFDKGSEDFGVCCDDEGNIYLLCQDDTNNIYMFYFDKTSWRRQCILESKSKVPYDKNFSVIVKNGWINAFYTINHSDKKLLIHHILNNNSQPKVIENSVSSSVYAITSDTNDNIYLVYQKESIGFQVYNWSTKTWQSFSPVQKLPGEVCSISAICDFGNGLHITCSVRQKNEFSLYYLSRNGTEKIADGFLRNPEPVILYDDKYYILYKTSGRLMQCISENPELSFMKPSYYFPGSFTPHNLFKISSSKDLKESKIFAEKIYGAEPRPNSFEASIIQEKLDKLDFSLPKVPTIKTPDIETFAKESEPFSSSQE